jgi:hypothetical protein
MTPSIGFVLLTHNKPRQVIRLIQRLDQMFEQPPIVCHHDFSQSHLPIDDLPHNTRLVQPYYKTGWSLFSVIDGMLEALALMYTAQAVPDWFVLLSGSDYPIKPASQILADLAASAASKLEIRVGKLD